MRKLAEIAEPPLERLETITARLEETGTVTEETAAELRQVISRLSMTITGADARTAARLSFAAEMLGTETLRKAARQLAHAIIRRRQGSGGTARRWRAARAARHRNTGHIPSSAAQDAFSLWPSSPQPGSGSVSLASRASVMRWLAASACPSMQCA